MTEIETPSGEGMKDSVSAFFDAPFDAKKINESFTDAMKVSEWGKNGPVEVYRQPVSQDIDFVVINHHEQLVFSLRRAGFGEEKETEIGSLEFAEDKDKPGGIDMPHRYISREARQAGITGSMFLQKAEDYIRTILSVRGAVTKGGVAVTEFRMNAGQTDVIDWAMKNGYALYKYKAGESKSSEDTEEVRRYYERVKHGQEPGIIITGALSPAEKMYRHYIIPADKEEEFLLARGEAIGTRDTTRDRRKLQELSVRFFLRKPIWPDKPAAASEEGQF